MFFTIAELRARYGVTDMCIWRWMHNRGFPAALRFGGPKNPRRWCPHEVEAWERQQLAATTPGKSETSSLCAR